jgi:hypothetical protein
VSRVGQRLYDGGERMTRSTGRFIRLVAGVIAAALGVFLMILGSPAASADGSGTMTISVDNLSSHACQDFVGAHFVINQIKDGPTPANITVYVNGSSTGATVDVSKSENSMAHYDFTFAHVGDWLSKVTASIYSGWSGNFELSDCTGVKTPPVTTTSTMPPHSTSTVPTTKVTTVTVPVTTTSHVTVPTTVTVTKTESGSTVTTTVPASTVTETSTVTQSGPGVTVTIGGVNQTVTNQVTSPVSSTVPSPVSSTVTSPVSSTVTNQIQVSGVSSEMTTPPSTSSSIQVMGASSTSGPAPSANARTGQNWGILPYLLFGGGLLLTLTGLRVRRGGAH